MLSWQGATCTYGEAFCQTHVGGGLQQRVLQLPTPQHAKSFQWTIEM